MDTSPEPENRNPYPSTPRQTASPRKTPQPRHHNPPLPTHHALSASDDDARHPPLAATKPATAADEIDELNDPTFQPPPPEDLTDDGEDEEEEEDDARPNRWRGHPATWLSWTEREREVWTAMENVRGGDLGVHLYNVVGWRRGFRRGRSSREEEGGGGGKVSPSSHTPLTFLVGGGWC